MEEKGWGCTKWKSLAVNFNTVALLWSIISLEKQNNSDAAANPAHDPSQFTG